MNEINHYKKKLDEYKETNDLCADQVRDLVGMIQWKYIEVEFVKKSFDNKVTEDEKAKFETQKAKEKRIFERMLNNYKQLEEIKKREREEDEDENILDDDEDYSDEEEEDGEGSENEGKYEEYLDNDLIDSDEEEEND